MPDTDSSGLWPDAETLAAGDEDEVVYEPLELGDLEDGHLEADDYFRRHPDAE